MDSEDTIDRLCKSKLQNIKDIKEKKRMQGMEMDGEDIFCGIGMVGFYRQPNFDMPGQSCYVNVGNENLGK